MSTFSKLSYHVVFGTKYRQKSIDDSIQIQLYKYIGGIVRNIGGSMIQIGGVEDHIHVLTNLPPSKSVSNCIRDIKANSSRWINELPETKSTFAWQKGYGAFTVSFSQIPIVTRYIENQKTHHLKMTFKQEYLAMLKRHQIPFEDKYLFEAENLG